MRWPTPAVWLILLSLTLALPRRSRGEDRLDLKYMYYQEDDDRIRVLSPAFLLEKDFSSTLTLRLQGVYDAISGASPTGAPATQDTSASSARSWIAPGRLSALHAVTGASSLPPAPPPVADTSASASSSSSSSSSTAKKKVKKAAAVTNSAPETVYGGSAPVAELEDERVAATLDLIKRAGLHTLGVQAAFSTESDYDSFAFALRDAIEFNQRNTTLNLGAAANVDQVDNVPQGTEEDKVGWDALVGLTQLLNARTVLTANLSAGSSDGYLDDPYKVAEVDGLLVPDNRPGHRDRQVALLALQRRLDALQASLDASYRFYRDSFGVEAHTFTLQWFQDLGRHWVLAPLFRGYWQSEADFFAPQFTGAPRYYSSDYRLSALQALGYGVQTVWRPNEAWSLDVTAERYEQEGRNDDLPDDAYPSATMITAGIRRWF